MLHTEQDRITVLFEDVGYKTLSLQGSPASSSGSPSRAAAEGELSGGARLAVEARQPRVPAAWRSRESGCAPSVSTR